MPKAGRQITFYTDIKLKEWLNNIPKTHLPQGATQREAYSLMVLLWYSGARATELAEFEKNQIYPLLEGAKPQAFMLTLITKKRKDNEYRKIPIPYNPFTLQAYRNIKDSLPQGYYFHAFRGSSGYSNYTTKWTNSKVIYVREPNGQLMPEQFTETKQKSYVCHNKKIRNYITSLTGLPPLYFRHHRFSWMARLGATTTQIKEFKGAKDSRSVEPYLQYSDQVAKETLTFFPKDELNEN